LNAGSVRAVLHKGSHECVLETFSNFISFLGSGGKLLSTLVNGAFLGSPVVSTVILIVLGVVSAENVASGFFTNVPALLNVAVLVVEVLEVLIALVEVLAFPSHITFFLRVHGFFLIVVIVFASAVILVLTSPVVIVLASPVVLVLASAVILVLTSPVVLVVPSGPALLVFPVGLGVIEAVVFFKPLFALHVHVFNT